MAILTLTPSRFGTEFEEGSYAYVVADRPVTYLGMLVTPAPITMQSSDMRASLIPNSQVDEGEEFFYSLSVFDSSGNEMYRANIVMPDEDVTVFDLIPVEQDLDSCSSNTLEDNSQ